MSRDPTPKVRHRLLELTAALHRREFNALVERRRHQSAVLRNHDIYRPAEGAFQWRLLRRRPAVQLAVFRCKASAWALFAPHHYLSGSLLSLIKPILGLFHLLLGLLQCLAGLLLSGGGLGLAHLLKSLFNLLSRAVERLGGGGTLRR